MDEKKKVEVSKIAKELGISSTTVSRALSGKGRISEETKNRILEYIEENHIIPQIRTSKFQDKKTMNIAVVLPGEEKYAELPYSTKMLMVLYDFFRVRGYCVLLIRTSWDDLGALRDVVRKHKIDGVILTRILDNCADIKFLQEKEVPFVVVGSVDDDSIYQVDVDQRGGCHDLTDILIKKGIRKMALFCANLRQTVSQSRLNGYLDAMRENDLLIDHHLILEDAGESNVLEKGIEDILKEQVECVICSDDGICITVLDYFRQLGISVPRDIKVASFFNSMLLEESNSSITSINFELDEPGKAAGGMLIKLLTGEPCEKRKILGYKILLKESTQ